MVCYARICVCCLEGGRGGGGGGEAGMRFTELNNTLGIKYSREEKNKENYIAKYLLRSRHAGVFKSLCKHPMYLPGKAVLILKCGHQFPVCLDWRAQSIRFQSSIISCYISRSPWKHFASMSAPLTKRNEKLFIIDSSWFLLKIIIYLNFLVSN